MTELCRKEYVQQLLSFLREIWKMTPTSLKQGEVVTVADDTKE